MKLNKFHSALFYLMIFWSRIDFNAKLNDAPDPFVRPESEITEDELNNLLGDTDQKNIFHGKLKI